MSTQHQYQHIRSINTNSSQRQCQKGSLTIHGLPTIHGIGTNKYKTPAPASTQHQYQKRVIWKHRRPPSIHSIVTNAYAASMLKGDFFFKIMGSHQYTATAPTNAQHRHQQAHSINTKRGCLFYHGLPPLHSISTKMYTASTPTSTQHQCQKEMFSKDHGEPPVHSISTSKYTASVPTDTQHSYQQVMCNMRSSVLSTSFNKCRVSAPTSTQHQYQKGICFFLSWAATITRH